MSVDQKRISEMMSLLEAISLQTGAFAKQAGLKCKEGCGACCSTPEIETTVAEVLPLAEHLWVKGHAQAMLEAIQSNPQQKVCVLYKPSLFNKDQGSCRHYAFRPGLCRIFGFSGRKDKYGQLKLMTCKVIKDSQANACQSAQEAMQKGTLTAPLLAAHSFSVANIDPVDGQQLLPINEAIKQALEKVGFVIRKTLDRSLE